MSQGPKPDPASAVAIAELVNKCWTLCQRAEATIGKLPPQRESFLTNSLGDALKQLELVLRVLGDEQGTTRKEERQGLLRKLFARTPSGVALECSPPRFDISHQGLQGNTLTVSLTELLGFLSFARKTGVLWVDAPDENFLIGLVEGRMMHASSDRTPEGLRLGEVLVHLGHLTRRQLERFLEKCREEGASISGEILLKHGMISEEELHAALRYQVQQLVMRVVGTKTAIFRFREGMEILLACKVDLDINRLLLETARNLDEANDAARKNEVIEDWNAWQRELTADLATTSGLAGASGADRGPSKDADAPRAAKTSESGANARRDQAPSEPWGKK